MIVKALFIALISSWSAMLLAQPLNGTVCSGKTLAWEDVSDLGGAGVGPSGITSHSVLKIDGTEVERLIYKVSAPFPKAQFAVQFDEQTKQILQNTGNLIQGSQTYSILMNVQKVDGSLEINENVTCRKYWAMLP